jgi:hypothetical protein
MFVLLVGFFPGNFCLGAELTEVALFQFWLDRGLRTVLIE